MKHKVVLTDQAQGIYKGLKKKIGGDFQEGDEILLTILANSIHTYNQTNEILNERGPVLAGGSILRQNPAFQIIKESARTIETLCGHFGLSPKSRKQPFRIRESEEEDFVADFKAQYGK